MAKTTRMTVAQAIVKFLDNQYVSMDGVETKFVEGFFTIFGHGIAVGLCEALETNPGKRRVMPVSYTHLDVYKRQGVDMTGMENRKLPLAELWEKLSLIHISIEEDLPETEEVKMLLESLGAPSHPAEVGLSMELVKEGIQVAKEVRDRYTLLQILWDLGLEEEYSCRMAD